jgi:glycosyltransferase involved in cell wall biosynthesis
MLAKDKVLIIIPAYNEEDNILKTYNSIKNYKDFNYDVVVINDGSNDSTERILFDNRIPHVTLIQNLGIGGAVQTGYKYALDHDYDIAVQFDGDGQHDINYVKNIIKPIINNQANMVIGSRFILPGLKGFKSSKARRCGIKIISNIIKTLTHKKVYDPTSGFRAVDKNIIKIFADDYPTEYPEPVSEVSILKQNFSVQEVPVVMHDRVGGKSSIHAWKNVYYMINVTIAMFIESIKR